MLQPRIIRSLPAYDQLAAFEPTNVRTASNPALATAILSQLNSFEYVTSLVRCGISFV
jgi:hypothetical protein